MRDLHLTITQAKHDATAATAVAAAIGTNTPAGDQAYVAAAVAITAMRGGRPTTVVPPADTAAGVAAVSGVDAVKQSDAKKKPPLPTHST